MSKFLYPIYKLKTKSYIKWWLYHKKAGESGVLSEILQGFSFNLENTLNRKFKLFEIEGNSVQDGSPSPDNEVPIESAGDNGSINEKIQNKNLCKITDFSKAVANVQIKAENNILSFNGTTNNTISANDAIWKNIKLEVKEKGVYTPSLEKSITGVAFGYYKENSSTLISPYSELEVGSYTLGIYVPANTAFNNFTTGVQIEKGTTATPYVPHEEQEYSIFVQQPMRSIGDVRDCFVKKSDGWYERHYIGQVVLNGTESWMQSIQSNQRFIAGTFNNTLTNSSQVLAMSEKYRGIKFDDLNSDINYTCYSQEGWFGFNTKNIVSLSEWKEELSNDNLRFNYVLATPLDLPCTPEQIQQLENLPSTYKDFTIIQSQDETPAYLKIQYYKEG